MKELWEGRLRCDRREIVFDDVLTADYDRKVSTRAVSLAPPLTLAAQPLAVLLEPPLTLAKPKTAPSGLRASLPKPQLTLASWAVA